MKKKHNELDLYSYTLKELHKLMIDSMRFKRILKHKDGRWYSQIIFVLINILLKLYEKQVEREVNEEIQINFDDVFDQFKAILNTKEDENNKEKKPDSE